MTKLLSTIRSYEMLVLMPKKFHSFSKLLQATHDLYNKGAHVFTNCFLNMLAGYEVNFQLPYFKYTNEDDKESTLVMPPHLAAFLFWFSLESKDRAPKKYTLSDCEILPNYLKYNRVDGEVLEEVRVLADFAHREDAVWVDRRRAFEEWNKDIGFTSKDIKFFFGMKDMPLFKSGIDSHHFWRGVLSDWWGQGRKADNEAMLVGCQQLKSVDWSIPITAKEAVKKMFGCLGVEMPVDPTFAVKALRKKLGATGALNKIDVFVNTVLGNGEMLWDDKGRERLINALNDQIAKKMAKLAGQEILKNECYKNILMYIEKEVGIKYRGLVERSTRTCVVKESNLQSEFGEMACLAWRSITSHITQVYNQYLVRQDYNKVVVTTYTGPSNLAEVLAQYKEQRRKELGIDREYFLRSYHVNGLGEAIQFKLAGEVDPVAMAQNEYEGRFGDHNFISFIINHPDLNIDNELAKHIYQLVDREHAAYKMSMLRMPVLQHCDSDNHPHFVEFGDSRPYVGTIAESEASARYREETGQPGKLVGSLPMSFFDGEKFHTVLVPVAGKRVMRDLLGLEGVGPKQEGSKVFRNTRLSRKVSNVDDKADVKLHSPLGAYGVKLVTWGDRWYGSGEKRWYIFMSPKVCYPPPPKRAEVEAFSLGMRFMGVDLGIREAASYAVWEVCQAPPGKDFCFWHEGILYRQLTDSEGTFIAWAKLIESGECSSLMKTITGAQIDVLADPGMAVTQEDLVYFNEVAKFCGWDRDARNTIDVLFCDLAKAIKRKIMLAEFVTEEDRRVLLDVIERFTDGKVGSGGLNYDRINTFVELIRAGSSYIKKVGDDTILEQVLDTLRLKLRNIKRERVRLSVNAIFTKALDVGAKALVVENLRKFDPRRSRSKFTNRSLGMWCPQQILDMLEDQTEYYGLYLKMVSPYNTSKYDFASNQRKMRLHKVKIEDLRSPRWYDYFKKWLAPSRVNCFLTMHLREVLEEYGATDHKELVKICKDNKVEFVYLPTDDGPLFKSDAYPEPISADVNAACNIAFRVTPFKKK